MPQGSPGNSKVVQERRPRVNEVGLSELVDGTISMADKPVGLLTPRESVVALVDYQPRMLIAVCSHAREQVLNNAVALAKAAKVFDVPVVLTTITEKTFSGNFLPEIQAVFPDLLPIARTTMNSWEDENFRAAVTTYGRTKIIIAGLWTGLCVCFPSIDAISDGYEVHVPADACGDISTEAHERAIQRAIQAGVVPMTTLQVMFEWQRDWARAETYDGCMEILKAHAAHDVGARFGNGVRGERSDN